LSTEVKYASPGEPSRIACPFCSEPVAIAVEAVLNLQPIACASCGAELAVDQSQSSEALAALAKWHADTADARAGEQSGAEPPQTSRARRRPSRRQSPNRR